MGSYALSRLADGDVLAIARDSVQNWGVDQAERYVLGLHSACEFLAQFSELGRRIDHIRAGYWRKESGRHVVFYRTEAGILIVRVLHERMDMRRHL